MIEDDMNRILDYRLSLLESMVLPKDQEVVSGKSITERVTELQTSMGEIEKDLPDLKPCVEMLMKLKPFLNMKNEHINSLLTQVQLHLARKDELLQACEHLKMIKELEHVIESDKFQEIIDLEPRIKVVEERLQKLYAEVEQQQADMNRMIDTYEKMMLLMGKYFESWEIRISRLEAKKEGKLVTVSSPA